MGIAECGAIIREQLRPALEACEDPFRKCNYTSAAVDLVRIGAVVGDAIARLRTGASTETRHRVTVERVAVAPPGREGEG